jgi:hypothetical protein
VISNCDTLASLHESIEHFLNRLKLYMEVSLTPEIDEILVKILVELIAVLALVTQQVKQRRLSKSVLPYMFHYSDGRSQGCKETIFWK